MLKDEVSKLIENTAMHECYEWAGIANQWGPGCISYADVLKQVATAPTLACSLDPK